MGERLVDLILKDVNGRVSGQVLPEVSKQLEIKPSELGGRIQDLAPLAGCLYRLEEI